MRGIIATIVAALFGFFGYFWGFFFRQRNKQNVAQANEEQKGAAVLPPKKIDIINNTPEKKKDNNIPIKEEKKIQEQVKKEPFIAPEKPKEETAIIKTPEKPKIPHDNTLRSENKLLFSATKFRPSRTKTLKSSTSRIITPAGAEPRETRDLNIENNDNSDNNEEEVKEEEEDEEERRKKANLAKLQRLGVGVGMGMGGMFNPMVMNKGSLKSVSKNKNQESGNESTSSVAAVQLGSILRSIPKKAVQEEEEEEEVQLPAEPITPKVEYLSPDVHSFTYDVLLTRPENVDPKILEFYMGDDEFKKIMGCNKEEWKKLAAWKKENKKKEVKLF